MKIIKFLIFSFFVKVDKILQKIPYLILINNAYFV